MSEKQSEFLKDHICGFSSLWNANAIVSMTTGYMCGLLCKCKLYLTVYKHTVGRVCLCRGYVSQLLLFPPIRIAPQQLIPG